VHNQHAADAADSLDDPLEQDAPDQVADDPAIPSWFLAEGDRANLASDRPCLATLENLRDNRAIRA
jgi:hypothetical protein